MVCYHVIWHPSYQKFSIHCGDLNLLQLKLGVLIVKTFSSEDQAKKFLEGMNYIIDNLKLSERIVELLKH